MEEKLEEKGEGKWDGKGYGKGDEKGECFAPFIFFLRAPLNECPLQKVQRKLGAPYLVNADPFD